MSVDVSRSAAVAGSSSVVPVRYQQVSLRSVCPIQPIIGSAGRRRGRLRTGRRPASYSQRRCDVGRTVGAGSGCSPSRSLRPWRSCGRSGAPLSGPSAAPCWKCAGRGSPRRNSRVRCSRYPVRPASTLRCSGSSRILPYFPRTRRVAAVRSILDQRGWMTHEHLYMTIATLTDMHYWRRRHVTLIPSDTKST